MDPTNDPQDDTLNASPDADETEALKNRFSNDAVLLLSLSSGRFAAFCRDSSRLHSIIDADETSSADLRQLGQELRVIMFQNSKQRDAARFYGEPDDKRFAQDLKDRRRQLEGPQPRKPKGVVVEITL